MFYCGYDPGLEVYLASQGIDTPPAPAEPAHIWAASVLLAITIVSLIAIGLV
ncbi:hypothetical protein [Cypionkella sp.]|uniref:hypothetical protein n=1 Tax=Cypionkella sp. TaxID=2811411 RepID=UPI002ABAAC49|nr:hypothetical protein [Cypionkella sp.]MDZ4391733.1 hypothetical protein [Cypionkella sp.]